MVPTTQSHRVSLLAVVSGLALVAVTGCHPAGQRAIQASGGFPTPVRAVWVTRFDYKTPDDVARIMDNCKQAGFNTVVFQVRGNGTVFYPSKIEPWAEQFDFQSPGFDPLALAIQEARGRGLSLHAWVNVIPAWRGLKPPADPEQLYNKHPDWFWYDQAGKRQPLTWFYVSLNPCLPEVRAYLVEVFRELLANYDLDGLHMDYIRFPNEEPAIPRGSNIDYPRDDKTLALYRQATGLKPDDNPDSWNRWRADQLTQLVADIRAMMGKSRPSAALSASVGAEPPRSMAHFRDEIRWVNEGLIDAAFPMNYRPDLQTFQRGLEAWIPLRDKVVVVPGLWFANLPPEEGVQVVKQQIEYAVQTAGSFCLFSYAGMFPSAEDAEGRRITSSTATQPTTRPDRASRRERAREQRRNELVPFIQSLSAPKPQV